HHRRHAGGRGRRADCAGHWQAESLHWLHRRDQGVYRGRAGRHRQYSRRHAGRRAAGVGRDIRRRLYLLPIQGYRGVQPAGADPVVPSYRTSWQTRSGKSLMDKAFKNAFIAALMTGVIIAPIFGFQILRSGMQTHLQADWKMILGGMAVVFVFQMVRPLLRKAMGGKQRAFSLPPLSETARKGIILVLIAIALVWPFFTGRAQVDIATLVLIYVMLGLGLNIVVGFAGLLDLGFVGFYAVGAYTYALLYHWAGWGFWEALRLAGAMAGLFGYLLGCPVLRLRGDYLAIVTLGFGEIIRLLLINLYTVTGGPDGISGIPKPTVFGYPMMRRVPEGQTSFHDLVGWNFSTQDVIVYLYLMALCLALITLFVSNRLIRMPVGRAWEALREDEIA